MSNAPYDKIAPLYDSLFRSDYDLSLDKKVAERLSKIRGTVLDVGCGTGLLLEIHQIVKENYVGIDSSMEMLKIFRQKFPGYETVHSAFETYRNGEFDNVIALYAVLNYVSPRYVVNMRYQFSNAKMFLIFYREGYYPEEYIPIKFQAKHYYYTADELEKTFGVKPYALGDFLVIDTL